MDSNILIKQNTLTGQTVWDFIQILLVDEGRISHADPKIQDAKKTLEQIIFPETLTQTATNKNITSFLLELNQKSKTVGGFYINLYKKYSSTTLVNVNKSSVFSIVENLLDDANVIIHPSNQVAKYFKDTNYAFSCGILCEDEFKFIPDKALQNLIQDTTRMRIAFLMTLIQLRNSSFPLNKIYLQKSVYSREISLSILFHSIEANIGAGKDKTDFEKYFIVRDAIIADIDKGILQLPDRKILRFKNPRKKILIKKEIKELFINEKTFQNNNLLSILSAYSDNIKKLSTQTFPVAVVKDPITGEFLRIGLKQYGIKTEILKQITLAKLSIISEDELDKYLRIKLAESLSNNPHKSVSQSVEEILQDQNLTSAKVKDFVAHSLKAEVYNADSWSRKLLYWTDEFTPDKTMFGNLTAIFVEKSTIPSSIKERIEPALNIPGSTVIATIGAFAIAGIPAAIVAGSVFTAGNYFTKSKDTNELLARGYLQNLSGLDSQSIETLDINATNPYFDFLKLFATKETSKILPYQNIFSKVDLRPDFVKFLNQRGVELAENVKFGGSLIKNLGLATLAKLGFQNKSTARLRHFSENLINVKNIASSGAFREKRTETLGILELIAKNITIFGYQRAVLAQNFISDLINQQKKPSLLSKLILPRPPIVDTSGAFSWFGRNLQKGITRSVIGLRSWTQRNAEAVTQSVFNSIGRVTSGVGNSLAFFNQNGLNRASSGLGFIGLLVLIFALFSTITTNPILVAVKTAYAPAVSAQQLVSSGSGGFSAPNVLNVNYVNQYIPPYAGNNFVCSAASVVMVASFLGKLPKDNLQQFIFYDTVNGFSQVGTYPGIRSLANGKVGCGNQLPDPGKSDPLSDPGKLKTNDTTGINGAYLYTSQGSCNLVYAQGITGYLSAMGIKTQPLNLQVTGDQTRAQVLQKLYSLIKQTVDAGFPLILSIKQPADHILVIRGYKTDDTGQIVRVIVNDPYTNLNGVSKGLPANQLPSASANGQNAEYNLNDENFVLYYALATST